MFVSWGHSEKEVGFKQVRAATAVGVRTQESTATTLGRERAKTACVKNPGKRMRFGNEPFPIYAPMLTNWILNSGSKVDTFFVFLKLGLPR